MFGMQCAEAKCFIPPPEAPVFEPSWEEFKDPLVYIDKIRAIGERYGICKIRPPPLVGSSALLERSRWQPYCLYWEALSLHNYLGYFNRRQLRSWEPPFAIDFDTFRFTPRIQKLNELEILSRVKMNYLDQLSRFWSLQGLDFKIPLVEKKALDLFRLRKIVSEEGGLEVVNGNHKWPKIVQRMGYSGAKTVGAALRSHYERIILPYDEFRLNHSWVTNSSDKLSDNFCLEEAKQEVTNGEQTGSEAKSYIKVPKARRMGSEVRVKGKHMLHCYTSGGTKIKITTSPMKSKDRSTSGMHKTEKQDINYTSAKVQLQTYKYTFDERSRPDRTRPESEWSSATGEMETETGQEAHVSGSLFQYKGPTAEKADKYFCEVCADGDDEEHMLLCDGCDDAYHMNCLTPPLTEVPPGDWRCPKCLVQECSKPLESYGFEQSQQEYTLETFGSMADKFKADHFSAPPQSVPYGEVEKEYWRLVSCMQEDVSVEYGADIHAGENGSGFPTEKTRDQFSGDEEYIVSGWNLNNLPVLGSSLLQFVSVDISGMKVPWCYVGMCFSSFSWHTEDHWSYSINYLHRGEAKTWYGIPGSKAELLEECMKSLAPDLFAQSPDILHQLTTIMNPNLLMAHGVPIYRTDQEAGNFIITFPRSYHAGFNQGYNFAEAVNFCPADWVPMGRGCIEHYRSLKRQCVFSHDELLCQIAENAQKVDIILAHYVYNDLKAAIEKERYFRKKLTDQGVVATEQLMFELQGDDERQCDICNTTCFLSALKCPNRPNVVTCIDHSEVRCDCDASAHSLVYRYTLDELESLLLVLKGRADQLDDWQQRAKAALDVKTEKKKDVVWLKELIVEVTSKNLPKTKELEALKDVVSAAEVCIDISRQLLDRKIRSSNRSSSDSRNVSRLTLAELENFCQRVETLPCTFKEAVMFQDLLTSVGKFKKAAADILKSASISSVATLEFQIDWGTRLEVDLPEIVNLNEMLMIAKWMSEYEKTMTNRKSTTLLELRKLKNVGANLQPHPSFQSSLAKVMNLLAQCENLEQRAVGCLTTGCRPSIADLESLVKESEALCVDLPHMTDIKALLKTAKDWVHKVEAVLSDDIRFLVLDEVKSLQMQGEKIPVELELLGVLHKKLHSIEIWKDELSQVFVDKSNKEILQDLVQEIDAGGSTGTVGAGQTSGQEINGNALNNSVVEKERLAKLRLKKLEELRKEHNSNLTQSFEQAKNYESCFNCNKDGPSHVQQCLTCATKYLDCWNKGLVLQVACEKSYVCPSCYHMKRRVAIEDVQQLVSSWRQLGFLLTEGKALEYLAAEVSRWQRMARLVLSTDEVTSALKLLGFPISNSRIWRRESVGEKSVNDAGLQSKTCGDASRTDYSEVLPYPIDLSLSSARKEVRPKAPEDLVQKLLTDSAVQQQLVMNMDLSVEAQATLSDLLLESRVLRVGTEEAHVIGFLLFAAWQRTVLVEARRKEEELRKKREEEELRRKREEELRRKREEELRRRREEELRRRKEEEELRRKREEELRRKREEEELRRKREEELRRKREEEELRRKLEEEELQRKREEEEMRRREEELRKKREEEELQKKRKEELRRKKEEEDLKRKREEEMKIREEEEKKKKKELEVHKRKEAEMRSEQLAAQMKKDALDRKRFQELQRVSDEDRKRRRLDDKSPEKIPKKNSDKTDKKEEKLSGDNQSKNQENKKKNEENREVQNEKNTKAKKRKAEQPMPLVEQEKKLKKDDPKVKDGQKKLKGNRNNKKKKKRKSESNDDDEDDDDDDDGYIIYQEPCASKNCLNPSDPDVVEWVQCDSCDQWYHLICQGLEPKQVSGNKQYFCPSCPQPSEEAAKSQGSTSEQGFPASSPKSKKKNASSKEQNGSNPQKPQNALSNKEEEKVGIGGGQVKEKSGKNAANKKLASTAAGPASQSGSLDKFSRKNPGSADIDVLKPGSEASKKKTKKVEKSPPKTASEEPISKRNSVFPGWSQQLTDSAKATEDKDTRQEEGSKVAQNTYFKQYLYTPWLANKSSSSVR